MPCRTGPPSIMNGEDRNASRLDDQDTDLTLCGRESMVGSFKRSNVTPTRVGLRQTI